MHKTDVVIICYIELYEFLPPTCISNILFLFGRIVVMLKTKNGNNNHNSSTLSSRIDNDVFEKLVNYADSTGISMNSLVNSILKKFIVLDQFHDDIGLVPMTKRTLKKIFRTMDDVTIKKIANDVGGTVPQELIYLSYNRFDFENLMNMIEISDSRFGKVKYTVNDSKYTITILHGISENFSKFLAETHQSLADDLSLKFTVQHLDHNMVCIEFEKPDNFVNPTNM